LLAKACTDALAAHCAGAWQEWVKVDRQPLDRRLETGRARQLGQKPVVGGVELGGEGGGVDRRAFETIERVEPLLPRQSVGVQRASEVEQDGLGPAQHAPLSSEGTRCVRPRPQLAARDLTGWLGSRASWFSAMNASHSSRASLSRI